MNKKFLVTAMSLVLAGGMGLANADTKLYGQLDVSLDSTDVDGGADDVNMGSNRSSVGVKGKEDLGNGMKAFYKVEWQVDVDDSEQGAGTNEDDTAGRNDSEWKGRDMFVGMKFDGFGKIAFGSLSTAYKSPGSKLDPFYRSRNQARNIGLQSALHKGRGEEGQGRATNTVRYDSPSISGFKLTGTYTFDNNKNGGVEDDDPYSLGVTYKGGNLFGFASYISNGDDDKATQLGIKYSFGDAAVWGMYEKDDGLIGAGAASGAFNSAIDAAGLADPDCDLIAAALGFTPGGCSNLKSDFKGATRGNVDGQDIFNIGASYKIGNNLVAFDYAEGDDLDVDGFGGFGGYTTWRLGAKHNFSKRTSVTLTHSNVDVDDVGETDITSLGLRIKF